MAKPKREKKPIPDSVVALAQEVIGPLSLMCNELAAELKADITLNFKVPLSDRNDDLDWGTAAGNIEIKDDLKIGFKIEINRSNRSAKNFAIVGASLEFPRAAKDDISYLFSGTEHFRRNNYGEWEWQDLKEHLLYIIPIVDNKYEVQRQKAKIKLDNDRSLATLLKESDFKAMPFVGAASGWSNSHLELKNRDIENSPFNMRLSFEGLSASQSKAIIFAIEQILYPDRSVKRVADRLTANAPKD